MQPKAPRKKDPVPILFSSPPVSPLKSPEKTSFGDEVKPQQPPPENAVYVYLQFVETNLVKVKTKSEQEQQQALTTELSFKKRDHSFLVNKDDIKLSKYLRSNYLPADNMIEIPLSVNVNLPHAKFPTLERIIRAVVEKEKKNAPSYPLEVSSKNCVEMFAGACLLGLDELAIFIYQVVIKPKLNLKLLIGLLLITLECSLAKLYMELYQIFREYWLASDGWADPSPMAAVIMEGKDDGTSIECEDDIYKVYLKEELEFTFPVSTLKRPFDIFRRDFYRQYLDPEQKFYAMHIRRRRNIEDNDGLFESNYPHKFYLIDKQKNEVLLTAIRQTEYGDFYLFGKDEHNTMLFGGNYIGHIIANAWGTEFEVYDDGVDEDTLEILPKYLSVQRTKIATIKYDSNILGDVPREIKVEFTNFADKKPAQLVPMPPKYDAEKDCYTLNFYGKAQVASARNFILTFPHDRENIIFLQGKTAKDMFNVDFRHPLNFVQMFSISLASIGKKFIVS